MTIRLDYDITVARTYISKYDQPVKRILVVTLVLFIFGIADACKAASKISKVLPHLLDKQGRHTLSPSLLERDAYQAHLREKPDLCSGIRFDIKWTKGKHKSKNESLLKIKVELQTSGSIKPIVLTQIIKLNQKGGWDALNLDGERYKAAGKIIGWRVLLIEDDKTIAERRSFLWQMGKTSNKSEPPSAD